jgi:hypothetical protein
LGQANLQAEFFVNDRDQDVDAHCNPYLRLHGVIAGAKEMFDSKVLLDPLEEEFDTPTEFVDLGNG